MRTLDARQARWGLADPLVLCAVLVFVVYAGNFLYFFVDDEGIPLVFARNLLRGRGLSYNTLEGPVEGYTDFLHVLTSALTLGVVQAVGASTISVFFIGKAVSFLAGIGTVVMTWQTVRRTAGVTAMAALAGLLLLATAGPLAVWACSSLETATFVFLLSVLLFAVHAGQQRDAPGLDTLAAVSASAVVLERLDGPVYVAAVLGAYFLCADSGVAARWRPASVSPCWRCSSPITVGGTGTSATGSTCRSTPKCCTSSGRTATW